MHPRPRFLSIAAASALVASAFSGVASAAPANGFTVVERAVTDTTTDTGAKGDTVGDISTFHNPIFDAANHTKLGEDNGFCLRTVAGKSWECTWTTMLKDGQITVSGPFDDDGDTLLAVTGGTGAYAGVRGQMKLHARDKKGTGYDFSFNLIR